MSNDPTGGATPGGDADGRDDELAALLAVAPLDDHTRARLVRRALDEVPASTTRRSRPALLGVAAALIVIVVTGVVILTTGGGGQTSRAAPRASGPRPAAGPLAPTLAPGAAVPVAPRDLGAVGDVTDVTQLRRVVDGPAAATGRSLDLIRHACGDFGLVAGVTRVDTVGTGLDAGRPAAIIVGRDRAGRRVAVVVAVRSCVLLQRLALG